LHAPQVVRCPQLVGLSAFVQVSWQPSPVHPHAALSLQATAHVVEGGHETSHTVPAPQPMKHDTPFGQKTGSHLQEAQPAGQSNLHDDPVHGLQVHSSGTSAGSVLLVPLDPLEPGKPLEPLEPLEPPPPDEPSSDALGKRPSKSLPHAAPAMRSAMASARGAVEPAIKTTNPLVEISTWPTAGPPAPRKGGSWYDRARMATTGSGKLRALVIVLACAIPVSLSPTTARAETEEVREEAKRLFAQGSTAFLARRYADALVDLRASYKLVPSPNSGLLIARCLRELNRRVEAVEMYTAVAVDARRRAADGDAKYAQTAEVASTEGAVVRATLGTIRVRVARPPPGSLVEIDNAATPVTDAEIVVLHPPGDVTVKFKPRAGAEQSQRATVAAGGEVRMEFTPAAEAASGPSSGPGAGSEPAPRPDVVVAPAEGEPASWMLPAALVAGGVALVGGGIFAGFGLKSESTYNDLAAKCLPLGCGDEDRALADEGKRDQTIANVGLVVGIVGAASAITFLLVRAYGPRTARSAGAGATWPRFVVTAGGVGGTF
jgi:hypothetical protein